MGVWGVSPAFPTTLFTFSFSLSAFAKPLWCSEAAISHHNQMYNCAFPWQCGGAQAHACHCMLYAAIGAHEQKAWCDFTCDPQSSW